MSWGRKLKTQRWLGAAVIAFACALMLTSCQLLDTVLDFSDRYPDDIGHLSGDRMDQIVDLLVRHDADG